MMEKNTKEKINSTFNSIPNFSIDDPTSDLKVKMNRRRFSYNRLIALIALCLISIILVLFIKNLIYNSIIKRQLSTLTSAFECIKQKQAEISEEGRQLTELYSNLQAQEKDLSIIYEETKVKFSQEESSLNTYKTTLTLLQQQEVGIIDQITLMEADYSKYTAELIEIDKTNGEMNNVAKNLNSNLELLRKEYDDLIAERKKIEKEQNSDSVVGNILHSDIITTIDEYQLLRDWVGLGNDKILIQKYKLKGENSNELINNNKAILQELKPIVLLLKLSTGQRFGLAALTPLPSLRIIKISDESSFMFSFDKRQKYSFKECKQNMKTTYIVSFSSKTEIHIPDACFKDDHFFNIEEKIKFYRTKKHFEVEYMELYQLYDLL